MKTLPPHDLLTRATRFLFFTGKGGVGKTSTSCATAVALADSGKRVLLVSTDPASNLDEVLGQRLGCTPVPISGLDNLFALNIDPGESARAYREKLVGPLRGVLPEAVTRRMEEELSGACTLEIAAFDEFSALVADPMATNSFDHIIFDTAPTGHTLRLLTLPSAWTGFLENNTSGAFCLGPLAGLQKKRELYEQTVEVLADGAKTTLILVTRPEPSSLREAHRTSRELANLGVSNQSVIVNGIFQPGSGTDMLASALAERQGNALQAAHDFLGGKPVIGIPLFTSGLLGLDALRGMFKASCPEQAAPVPSVPISLPKSESLDELVETIARHGHGLIMTVGKGGVGKTTVAAAVAYKLAALGHRVCLTTTDPAAHVAEVAVDLPELEVTRIDPVMETRKYVDLVLTGTGDKLDPGARALLEEDLKSPCTEEIAVFRAFARTVAAGLDRFVVLDTAPTGHTLLLLDATEAFHREVARKASHVPDEVLSLLARLRDPEFTHVIVVTLPEATPVHEAASLQIELNRAGIKPECWVVNQCFSASETIDPYLRRKAENETVYIREVMEKYAERTIVIPWLPREPVGRDGLSKLFRTEDTPVKIL